MVSPNDPTVRIATKIANDSTEGGVNDKCHNYTDGVKANQKHVLRTPRIVTICWGNNYVTNSADTSAIELLLADLVTGPFVNGLAQYGISPGSIAGRFVIDTNTTNPAPATLDENQARDQIKSWIQAKKVFPAPSVNETDLMYFLFPPTTTTLTLTDGTTGFCGYHQHAKLNSSSQNDDFFWGIVSTSGSTPGGGKSFANSVAYCVSHELVEAFSNRDAQGYFSSNGCEISDICETQTTFQYRGWSVEQYWSNWDNTCIHGDQPVSLRKFLQAIGYDVSKGLRTLHTPVINLQYIASRM